MINYEAVKKMAKQKGADVCRVAPVSRFEDAPKGFHPHDIHQECESVIDQMNELIGTGSEGFNDGSEDGDPGAMPDA